MFAEIFGSYGRGIVFLHIASASLLLGSMIMVIFIVRKILFCENMEIKRYKIILDILKKYLFFIAVLMSILVSASIFMRVGLEFEYGNPVTFIMIHIKESIWIFMAFNFLYMFIKFIRAKKALSEEEFLVVDENLVLIIKYLMPLNLLLGMIAVYFGVTIRGY